MIGEYKFSLEIKPCSPGEQPDWVDLAAPDELEIQEIQTRYCLPAWLLQDPLDPGERPRISQENGVILMVVRICPLNSGKNSEKDEPDFNTVAVGIIMTGEVIITVCRREGLVAEYIRDRFARRRDWTCIRLALSILQAAGDGFIVNLELMRNISGEAEARMRRVPRNEEILVLLDLEKALIDITTALKSNYSLMDKLRQPNVLDLTLNKDDFAILEDAMTESQQAVFMAEIFNQVLSSMSDAFGSIISNNLNKIMKFMASVTIVLTIPAIIGALFGMNVELPGTSSSHSFWALAAACAALMLVVSFWFAKKKWF